MVVFLRGGGACWSWSRCYGSIALAYYMESGFGAEEFAVELEEFGHQFFFRRDEPDNPFAADSYVFVPYCTGDAHAGDRHVDYVDGDGVVWPTRHVGRRNIDNAIARIRELLPDPSRVVVYGESAGGMGALFNYHRFVAAFPDTPVFLIDDSGLPLGPEHLPAERLAEWVEAWNLASALPADCPACATDLAQLYPHLSTAFPTQRLAAMSFVGDYVMPVFYGNTQSDFEAGLAAITREHLAPSDNFRHFWVDADGHVVSFTEGIASAGVTLVDWLTAMVEGDLEWSSVGAF